MRSELLPKDPIEILKDDVAARILNVRVTHKRASLSTLGAFAFKNRPKVLKEIKGLPEIEECLVIETCNRVEIFVVTARTASALSENIVNFWLRKQGISDNTLVSVIERATGSPALLHLLRLVSGLESMIVGEDQVLGQVRDSFKEAKEVGTAGPILDRVLQFALRVGKNVRSSTKINEGSLSMGSVGVELLNGTLGDLKDRRILIIGAGEMGEIVGKALSSREAGIIFVANRTYRRAVEVSTLLKAQAIHFEDLERVLESVDAAVVATSAPHFILTFSLMASVMTHRSARPLVVIDLGQPRNVDRTIARLPGVILRDIDDLHELERSRIENRAREIRKAEKIIDHSLGQLVTALKETRVEPLISALCGKAEEIRRREARKALEMINSELRNGSGQESQIKRCNEIIEDLTKSIVEALLIDQIDNLRKSSANDLEQNLTVAEKILGIERIASERRKVRQE